MTKLNLSADEVLTTTRSVRKRLDFEREVSTETIMECLDIALQAPSGSNRQGWQWMFITDQSDRTALKEIYAENFAAYRQMPRPEYAADDPRAAATPRVVDSAQYLADTFEKAPVLLIPCLEGRPDAENYAAFWG